MAVEKILEEIKRLSSVERSMLRVQLDAEEITAEEIKISKKAAGGWHDINADKLIEDLYKTRQHVPGRTGADW